MHLVQRLQANPNWGRSHFPHNLKTSHEYLYSLPNQQSLCSLNDRIGHPEYVDYET